MLDFITSSLHPACNGCNYMRLHDHYMQNKMLMPFGVVFGHGPWGRRCRTGGPGSDTARDHDSAA
jgi:hypothetical protein